jgi:hypothetical protein
MNTSALNLCYNTTLAYIKNKYEHNNIFSMYNVSQEDIAIDVTASLFKKNTNGNIEISFQNNFEDNKKNEFLFLIITFVKEKVDKAIKFEMLKYDLITIEEYNTTFR